jgi:hypothetical protein
MDIAVVLEPDLDGNGAMCAHPTVDDSVELEVTHDPADPCPDEEHQGRGHQTEYSVQEAAPPRAAGGLRQRMLDQRALTAPIPPAPISPRMTVIPSPTPGTLGGGGDPVQRTVELITDWKSPGERFADVVLDEQYYLVKWAGQDELEWLPASDLVRVRPLPPVPGSPAHAGPERRPAIRWQWLPSRRPSSLALASRRPHCRPQAPLAPLATRPARRKPRSRAMTSGAPTTLAPLLASLHPCSLACKPCSAERTCVRGC